MNAPRQRITLIAAATANGCIGANNTLPWHIPEDFDFFKQYTLGKPVLMGRKTWDSLPRKPLPDRRNIVITRQADWQAPGAERANSLAAALAAVTDAAEVIIIGGAQIYAQALPLATDVRLTEVALNVAGDAFFPPLPPEQWQACSREARTSAQGTDFALVHYRRI